MDAPPVRYAKTDDGASIAFWSVGHGPPLILPPVAITLPPSKMVEVDEVATFQARLGERHTVIQFDHRGTGLSSTAAAPPPMDALVADLDAVTNALGSEPVAIMGANFNSALAINYAARHPDRISKLILWCGIPSWDDYVQSPQAQTVAVVRELGDWRTFTETVWQVNTGWSQPEIAHRLAAQMRDAVDQDTWIASFNSDVVPDVSDLLPLVSTPTLVLGRQDGYYGLDGSQMLATGIPSAQLVVLPGASVLPWIDPESVCARIDDFLIDQDEVGAAQSAPTSFRTILFTDLESSTALTQAVGDAKAQDVLHGHNAVVRAALAANDGEEVKHTGDGIMASFGSAVSAVEAAQQIQRDLAGGEIRVRVGLNAGEPIAEDHDYFGTAVQLAARICDRAEPGQVLVSRVVRDLCAGKTFTFEDAGAATLKGIEEPVTLYAVGWVDV